MFIDMKKIFYPLLTTLLCFQVGQLNAQDVASKKVQAGLTFNAGANFLSPGTTKITSEDAGFVGSIGIAMHSSFKSSENLGLSTGLDFDFGRNSYNPTSITYVDYVEGEVMTQENAGSATGTMRLQSRELKTIKLYIPLMLMFPPLGVTVKFAFALPWLSPKASSMKLPGSRLTVALFCVRTLLLVSIVFRTPNEFVIDI